MVIKMRKLIRQVRSLGSLRKGCGVHAEHQLLINFQVALILRSLLSEAGARKPKHPSGHPPANRGSNFSSTPQGGSLKRCIYLVLNTIGGMAYRYKMSKILFFYIKGLTFIKKVSIQSPMLAFSDQRV